MSRKPASKQKPLFDVSRLSRSQWKEYLRPLLEPSVSLAARVGRFEPPFEYLKHVRSGFSSSIRFILEKALSADPLALALRDRLIDSNRRGDLNEIFPPDHFERDLWREFFLRYETESRAFGDANYPWESYDPYKREALLAVRNPAVDSVLDEVIFGALGEYGFGPKGRKTSKGWWRCWSEILPHRILIEVEKAPIKLDLTAYLKLPSLHFFTDVAHPFFFSQFRVPFNLSVDVRHPLALFFDQYAKMFPEVFVALEKGTAGAEEWLKDRGLFTP